MHIFFYHRNYCCIYDFSV